MDITANALPNYGFIEPNLCNDAHDCALSTADNWLKEKIAPAATGFCGASGGFATAWFGWCRRLRWSTENWKADWKLTTQRTDGPFSAS